MITVHPPAPAAQKKKKQSNAVQPIRKVDGSEKGNSKRESWIPIHTDVWESPDENESRAYISVHES